MDERSTSPSAHSAMIGVTTAASAPAKSAFTRTKLPKVSSSTPAMLKMPMDAGAKTVQLLTGLIYRGPGVAKQINRELAALRNGGN